MAELNTDRIDALMRGVAALDGKAVRIGSVGDKARANFISNDEHNNGEVMPFSVAENLSWHVYGLGVPLRDPIRPAVKKVEADAARYSMREFSRFVYHNGNGEKILETAAEIFAAAIRDRITGFIHPVLHPITKANPYRDKRYIPLLDTRQIFNSIGWRWEGAGDAD